MHNVWKIVSRKVILWSMFFMPLEKRVGMERHLRGREEARKLRLADVVVVSFGKSGRTWLRVMISRFLQIKFAIPEKYMLGFDNFHRKNPAAPRVFFTHDNYLRDYTGHTEDKSDFYDKKVVLLVRDPRDTAVSQFFQWKFRMKPAKKMLNKYPAHGADTEVYDFLMLEDAGLRRVIRFLNGWAQELPRLKQLLVVRYEDMRKDPNRELARVVEFMGTPGSEAEVKEAVDYAAFENMKKLEEKKTFRLSGSRLVPADRKNPHSYKVRRAKVGGYRDYFDDEQVASIEELVNSTLLPDFGYKDDEPPVEAANA